MVMSYLSRIESHEHSTDASSETPGAQYGTKCDDEGFLVRAGSREECTLKFLTEFDIASY
jgi:hypothetical protein